jgi:glucose/arabinose dehydrogenase
MQVWRTAVLVATLLSVVACGMSDVQMARTPTPPTSPTFDFRLQPVAAAAGINVPMDLQAPPGDPRLFIAERGGRIRIVKGGTLLATPFLDLNATSPRVYTDGEAGLLSFTFDPQYSVNGFVYVHFVERILNAQGNLTTGDILVERYQVSSNPDVLQTPGVEVIRIPHRDANNHYGGHVFFGPDNMLYLSTGDGGGANNQFGHAQDDASLLGKMLRLDVSSLPYAIPADNPVWSGRSQTRRENWAIGLRNPFRYAFDGTQLYIADVGQGAREEVDVVDTSLAGLNYGWSIMEGTQCLAASCNMTDLTLPVYDYDHGQGCAIIGGYVYRGAAIPELQGTYLFSDLCSGFLRGLTMNNGVATVVQAPNANAGAGVTQSFGQDGAGELYMLTGNGRVLKIVKP